MIRFENVHKWFGELHVLDDINFNFSHGKRQFKGITADCQV